MFFLEQQASHNKELGALQELLDQFKDALTQAQDSLQQTLTERDAALAGKVRQHGDRFSSGE